jgi:hypothetical protein
MDWLVVPNLTGWNRDGSHKKREVGTKEGKDTHDW